MSDSQDAERISKLAKKNAWTTGLLTFFFLPIGYIYTGRYKALFKGFGIVVLIMVFGSMLEDDDEFFDLVRGLYVVGATIENVRAVNQAKKLNGGLKQNNSANLPSDNNVELKLLKLIKRNREVTLADCVIETSLSSQQVRETLEEMMKQQLITIDNRESDGSIVYRLI
ncbi:MAG: hypothetical protein P5702_19440 [Limnospira sp. PMC 1291.21]|uniref:Uncharacterized protein n=2 Tax=Limnospira TaxID=2596745 RepID=A0A9P1KIA4_9CYAN|nr:MULTISPECIES: hypothetical protein [Limnospira]MBD2671853.1 hypothetical protein [Arthrospira platensis FACHB-439]EDZ94807.1 hypothetical protein AmaxDRAFT_2451 [Limnospira maxima CS-328]MDT9179787.1 hypothetical protein [Limnospira sp. PMC 1238.20]MDT9189968.1 hypothetical protein [Limnospira sp. PMC 894.15]MDT9195032.1 hypothetical protein [Limnospira sp. PMC 1245.20]